MKELFLDFAKKKVHSKTIVIACGLPASCKTPIAEYIAQIKGHKILKTDLIRLEILKKEDVFDENVSADMKIRESVYEEMFSRARDFADKDEGVVMDATFITQALRKKAAEIAERCGRDFIIIQTQCPEETCLRRISNRTRENYESNALTESAYLNNREKFQAVDLDDLKDLCPSINITHYLVDTTSDRANEWFFIEPSDSAHP